MNSATHRREPTHESWAGEVLRTTKHPDSSGLLKEGLSVSRSRLADVNPNPCNNAHCMQHRISGQHHGKCRSTSLSLHIGTNPDGPAVLLDQLLADPQPKAGSDRAFGREERIEDKI